MVKLNNVYQRILNVYPHLNLYNHKTGMNIMDQVNMKIYHTRVRLKTKVNEP